ncbi:MAG: hypothetical protein SWQ30_07515 [Thermodesulfobacteriota bacterium]|nr:hypothetical protein [Thermodesulfobacteriota bacterium]
MRRFRSNTLAQVLCFIAVAFFVVPSNVASVIAKEMLKATTKVEHKPIKYFVPEKRIKLQADVTDAAGVNLVRCYFRAVEQADYVFVAMKPGSSLYSGVIPAPSKETEILEYLFLVVNGENKVVKTQTFKVEKKDDDDTPAWQEVSSKGDIHVSTELAQAPTAPPGFADSIAIDVAESSARFGLVVGGLYTALQASESGGTSGTAAAADSAGTISAKTGGLSTLAYVGIGAALIAGGAAAAGGGGGGGGGGGSNNGGLSNVTVNANAVSLSFWDCSTNPDCVGDGDVIDASLNGAPILQNHTLSASPRVEQVTLNPGQNTLRVTAKEDGSCSGNVACLSISNVTSGPSQQEWNLSAQGYENYPSSATMTVSAPSTTTSTSSSTTTTSTTTTGTTTIPTTTIGTTTISTTTIPAPTTSSTTTAINPCAGNHPPQVGGVAVYGYPSTSALCVGDRIAFSANGYDADTNQDVAQINVTVVNKTYGTQGTESFYPQPSGVGQSFTISRITRFSAGYEGAQYCVYVQLVDKCQNVSNTGAGCAYSRDCSSHQDDDYYDNYY